MPEKWDAFRHHALIDSGAEPVDRPDELYERAEECARVRAIVDAIEDERVRESAKARFGFDGECETFRQIGERWGVSSGRADQIVWRALYAVRRKLYESPTPMERRDAQVTESAARARLAHAPPFWEQEVIDRKRRETREQEIADATARRREREEFWRQKQVRALVESMRDKHWDDTTSGAVLRVSTLSRFDSKESRFDGDVVVSDDQWLEENRKTVWESVQLAVERTRAEVADLLRQRPPIAQFGPSVLAGFSTRFTMHVLASLVGLPEVRERWKALTLSAFYNFDTAVCATSSQPLVHLT